MRASATDRLAHVKTTISRIRELLTGRTSNVLDEDPLVRAAYERFLEVISEASRHLPEVYRTRHPEIPWRQVAGLGNHIRHGYYAVDREVLWQIFEYDLDQLEAAIDDLIANPS